MRVIATAGHVDHGKSTLVRALTGMEPDRWAQERQRGMTIDLGYAWTSLPSGEEVAFVDVPGHQRFIGNMLAGLGPAPAVLFVVAADEGWRRQSGEHLAAVDALGLRHAVLAVTRSDLADPGPATQQALERLAGSSLQATEAVAVSGATGAGLADLRAALDRMVARLPGPQADGRVRLWVDRAFTIKGSGTVVTGTLGAGTLRVGDELRLGDGTVSVRALQRLGASHDAVSAVARVAVNLRSVPLDQVARGDVLCTPQRWRDTALVDVRLGAPAAQLPAELVLHVGTAAVPVRVRGLGGRVARLTLARPLPLQAGDRAILRDPGRASVAAGVLVLDADPPPLRRRGAAAARAAELASATGVPDLVTEVDRRGAARRVDLAALGIPVPAESLPDGVPLVAAGDWLITPGTWQRWRDLLGQALERHRADDPLSPGLPLEAARRLAAIPDLGLCRQVAGAAGLELADGRLRRPGAGPTLGGAEAGVRAIEQRLAADPFAAPERDDLSGWGLGPRELAAAVTAGRLLRLRDDVVLLPSGPARAMRLVAALPQPFTASDARQALGTTRRVVIPLLEHLDDRGWTRRVDGSHREVRRS